MGNIINNIARMVLPNNYHTLFSQVVCSEQSVGDLTRNILWYLLVGTLLYTIILCIYDTYQDFLQDRPEIIEPPLNHFDYYYRETPNSLYSSTDDDIRSDTSSETNRSRASISLSSSRATTPSEGSDSGSTSEEELNTDSDEN